MKILITGASGFAGSAYLKLALAKGHEVTILGRSRPDVEGMASVIFAEADITDRNSILAVAKNIEYDFDALINLAAYVPKKADEDNIFDAESVNVRGLINVLEAFKGRFKKHIFGSTAEVYDQRLISSERISSSSPTGPLSYYSTTKLAGEYIALSFGRKNGIKTTALRFSVMYGPNDQISRAIPNFIKLALRNSDIVINGGLAKRDYIHIDDVARSIECAIESSFEGVLPIGTGSGVTIEDTAMQIVKIAGSSSNVISDTKQGTDIIIDSAEAERAIGFNATNIFPSSLGRVIDSYRI